MDLVVASNDHDLRLAIELLVSRTANATVVGSTSDCDGLLALITSAAPDVVVLDWDMGCELAGHGVPAIRESTPRPRVIALGMDPHCRAPAIAVGAEDFVVKGGPPDQLAEALRRVSPASKT